MSITHFQQTKSKWNKHQQLRTLVLITSFTHLYCWKLYHSQIQHFHPKLAQHNQWQLRQHEIEHKIMPYSDKHLVIDLSCDFDKSFTEWLNTGIIKYCWIFNGLVPQFCDHKQQVLHVLCNGFCFLLKLKIQPINWPVTSHTNNGVPWKPCVFRWKTTNKVCQAERPTHAKNLQEILGFFLSWV